MVFMATISKMVIRLIVVIHGVELIVVQLMIGIMDFVNLTIANGHILSPIVWDEGFLGRMIIVAVRNEVISGNVVL